MPEVMTTGFLLAGFAWTLWWNLDWQRYIKFYGVGAPPYRRWMVIGVRGFFASCFLGAAYGLLQRLLERTRPTQFYRNAFLIGVAWFVVIVLMVKAVEWLAKRRKERTVSRLGWGEVLNRGCSTNLTGYPTHQELGI